MAENTEEVKIEATDDEELIVPAEETSEAENEEESSTSTEPSETDENTEEELPDVSIKDVEGETPREKALRLEVTRLKAARRIERTEVVEPTQQGDDVFSQYDKEELDKFDKLFDAMASKKGFVKKSEIALSSADDVLDSFLDQHPEYKPENDRDDVLWSAFKEELNLYKQPNNAKGWKQILERVHNSLNGGRTLDVARASAKNAKVQTAAHGGTTKATNTSRNQVDPNFKSYLKGFSDDEINDILS
jgi:hypothetical protein